MPRRRWRTSSKRACPCWSTWTRTAKRSHALESISGAHEPGPRQPYDTGLAVNHADPRGARMAQPQQLEGAVGAGQRDHAAEPGTHVEHLPHLPVGHLTAVLDQP